MKNYACALGTVVVCWCGTLLAGEQSACFQKCSWESYYQNTMNIHEPHKTLLLALKYFEMGGSISGKSADLGAGAGRDTLFLLKSGWRVLSLDAEALAIDIILTRADPDHLSNLEVQVASFADMVLPEELDLINASFSLPFCAPSHFDACWHTIVSSLREGGRFCGQFFGKEDAWADDQAFTTHTEEEVLKLFESQFEIEYLQIEKGRLPCANGQMKQWHIYHVVARKQ